MDAENIKHIYLFYMPTSTSMCHKPIGCAAQCSRSECLTVLGLGAVRAVQPLRVKCSVDVFMFNRPGVAGAVLQSPPSFINSLIV